MIENKFYINDLSEIRAFCTNSDKEDVYKYIYSLQQENQQLKEQVQELKHIMYVIRDDNGLNHLWCKDMILDWLGCDVK